MKCDIWYDVVQWSRLGGDSTGISYQIWLTIPERPQAEQIIDIMIPHGLDDILHPQLQLNGKLGYGMFNRIRRLDDPWHVSIWNLNSGKLTKVALMRIIIAQDSVMQNLLDLSHRVIKVNDWHYRRGDYELFLEGSKPQQLKFFKLGQPLVRKHQVDAALEMFHIDLKMQRDKP